MKTRLNRSVLKVMPLIAIVLALLGGGCGDSSNVAALQARIDALEKKQKEDGAKLAAMSEKVVTKAIEVDGGIKANIIEVGRESSLARIEIGGLHGISINSFDYQKKTGTQTIIDSFQFRMYDYASGDSSGMEGNTIDFGIAHIGYLGKRDGTTHMLMSGGGEDAGARFSARLEDALFASREEYLMDKESLGGFSVVGTGRVMFAVELLSFSDEGVVKFRMANMSAMEVSDVRGVVEYTVYIDREEMKSVKKSAGFIVERVMATGKWEDVTVVLEAKKKDIARSLLLKDIRNKYRFSK